MGWVYDNAMNMKQGENDEREARRFMGYDASLPNALPTFQSMLLPNLMTAILIAYSRMRA
jgi:hypothetical protein